MLASVLLLGCAVLAAGYYWVQTGAEMGPDPFSPPHLPATDSGEVGSGPITASGDAGDAMSTGAVTPEDAASPSISISVSREDIRQFLQSISGSESAALAEPARMVPAHVIAAAAPQPQPVFMQPADAVEAQRRISEASRRAVQAEDPRARASALIELAVIGDDNVLSTMHEALMDPDAHVRRAAVEAVQRIARYRGDDGGEILLWLSSAAQAEDAGVAELARAGANELAMDRGEEPPFP